MKVGMMITSQVMGDCRRAWMNRFRMRSGRAMSIMMVMPAMMIQARPTISAKRTKGRLHSFLVSRSTATTTAATKLVATKKTKLEM